MAKDMVVKNVSSVGTAMTIGREYPAKIDGDGKFRVKDDSGRWSKYSPTKFEIMSDPDYQMLRYGVAPLDPVAEASKHVDDIVTSTEALDPGEYVISDDVKIDAKFMETLRAEVEKSSTSIEDFIKDLSGGGKSLDYEALESTWGKPVVFGGVDCTKAEAETVRRSRTEAGLPTTKIEKEHEKLKKSMTLREILEGQGVPSTLINQMNEYRKQFTDPDMPDNIKARIPRPTELYDGGELWTNCITAILAGKHVLLSGGKATGKNTLTKSLAFAFQRPMWDMSFHANIGKDEIIGSETFRDGNVVFNPGMAYMCAMYGGIGVLDEINMAKDSAISVLNSLLDDRRVIDAPGYDRLDLHPATTFIGTMNYGYAGTRVLNEALASRFVIPDVREMTPAELTALLTKKFPNATTGVLRYFSGVFSDLQTKAHNAEISTASVDLRGIISALSMIEYGLNPNQAMTINVVNKAFEEYERKIVQDVVNTRIPKDWVSTNVFGSPKSFVVDMSEVK